MANKRTWGLGGVLTLGVFLLAMVGAPAWADDITVPSTSFDCVGPGACEQQVIHFDADPFKGWAHFTIVNLGSWGWLDFHLIIFEVSGFGTVENIDWIDSAGFEPTSSQSDLTWAIDNDATGATMDLYFNSDPVEYMEELTFSVYTDNTTDQRLRFGLIIYPTIVPEPSTALLLATGLVGLAIHGRRRRA